MNIYLKALKGLSPKISPQENVTFTFCTKHSIPLHPFYIISRSFGEIKKPLQEGTTSDYMLHSYLQVDPSAHCARAGRSKKTALFKSTVHTREEEQNHFNEAGQIMT